MDNSVKDQKLLLLQVPGRRNIKMLSYLYRDFYRILRMKGRVKYFDFQWNKC